MKPYHHEYKLMGLAPYATQSEVEKSYSVIKDIFKIDKELMSIVYNNKPSDLYFTLGINLEGIDLMVLLEQFKN